jgi:hypothetical protein
MSQYLKAFIVGSSFPTLALYLYAVQNIPESKINLSTYVFKAPIFLGTLNMLGLYLSKQYKLNVNQRYLLTSIIGFSIILSILYKRGNELYAYDSTQDWAKHVLMLLIGYLLTYNIIVRFIEESI